MSVCRYIYYTHIIHAQYAQQESTEIIGKNEGIAEDRSRQLDESDKKEREWKRYANQKKKL